ncbi:hypothetical protein [Leuconostoc lactis]|uniref:hypothetical protein n=1 Tax=Leuconostoc lactis TaxID=1246 RepID=UPI0018980169|nr:hypothetical protein [Leuconostoc lactis]
MSKRKLSTQEKNNKLTEQLSLLQQYAGMFDAGSINMALPMATQVRVLFHQTERSNSLLTQLELDNKFKVWHSPNDSFSPDNLIPSWDLLMMSVGPEGASYSPLGSKGLFNNRRDNFNNVIPELFLPIELWWNQIVFSKQGKNISRKDIVTFIANKDGGAHVDLQKWELDNYKEAQILGFYDQDGNYPNGNPLYAAMRQIVEEILVSFEVFQARHTKEIPVFQHRIQFLDLSKDKNKIHLYFVRVNNINDKLKDSKTYQTKGFALKLYANKNWSFIEDSKVISDISIYEVK